MHTNCSLVIFSGRKLVSEPPSFHSRFTLVTSPVLFYCTQKLTCKRSSVLPDLLCWERTYTTPRSECSLSCAQYSLSFKTIYCGWSLSFHCSAMRTIYSAENHLRAREREKTEALSTSYPYMSTVSELMWLLTCGALHSNFPLGGK